MNFELMLLQMYLSSSEFTADTIVKLLRSTTIYEPHYINSVLHKTVRDEMDALSHLISSQRGTQTGPKGRSQPQFYFEIVISHHVSSTPFQYLTSISQRVPKSTLSSPVRFRKFNVIIDRRIHTQRPVVGWLPPTRAQTITDLCQHRSLEPVSRSCELEPARLVESTRYKPSLIPAPQIFY